MTYSSLVGSNFFVKMNYRIAIVLAALLYYSCRNNASETETKRKYNSEIDSLQGNYDEIISVDGVITTTKYFHNHKLVAVATFEKGYLVDRMTVDSLGIPKRHFPLLVWVNVDRLDNLDTLKFEIKNVNPLTFYQYFYTTSSMKMELEGNTIQQQKPIDTKKERLIKIPANELQGSDTLYLKCGVVMNVSEADTTELQTWVYFRDKFHLK
jgi:hypothetical protein